MRTASAAASKANRELPSLRGRSGLFESRFWSKVTKTRKCWLWTGSRSATFGYGVISIKMQNGEPRPLAAHRVSWALTYGVDPFNSCVLHRCDTPSCVNPKHLFLGTRADNNADRDRKGRTSHSSHGKGRPGELNGRAKLSARDVIEIRHSSLLLREIVNKFGISKTQACRVRRGEGWK